MASARSATSPLRVHEQSQCFRELGRAMVFTASLISSAGPIVFFVFIFFSRNESSHFLKPTASSARLSIK